MPSVLYPFRGDTFNSMVRSVCGMKHTLKPQIYTTHPLMSITPVSLAKTNKFCITISVVFGNFVHIFLTLLIEFPFKAIAWYFYCNFMTSVRAFLTSCVFMMFCSLELFQVSSSARTLVNIF